MIAKKPLKRMIEVDLTSQEGNAFYLLGLARKLSKHLDYNYEHIRDEMMYSDYENLIKVFDKYFGSLVILYR